MDDFGRLPTEVINLVKEFYQLPTFHVISGLNTVYLQIKFIHATCIIHLANIYSFSIFSETLDKLEVFIKKLINNEDCKYQSSSKSIVYDKIHINLVDDYNNTIVLDNSCLDTFIYAMQQYYNILDTYPKCPGNITISDIGCDDIL